ncbi:Protein CBG22453 [Caenorhabditis briggsae]|uniref:Uncharacterized protein n=5 Tax=Caenorhabditis TaxID=6237 RepID=A0AAE9JFU2_CAEBR|nr:Protein CBG22453 [Caenorhabditis briggsae]ULT93642.1 hypothetical protein L3Y34_003263 [Caenorhabditis briggsae]UMM26910.1 hypothetical protein L5515_010418 [Caenorhabditis briggsae]CAP39037.1 Protein CBG22453 [Caenorhabditis briggsae]
MMFQLTPRRHELVSVFMVSIGTTFMFLGYDVQSMMAESVLHSVSTRNPDRISEYAGYYGQAIQYISFAFFSLFTATIQYYISSKSMLMLSSVLFAVCYVAYIHVNSYIFYSSQLLLGFAYAMYNSAEGTYLSEHSSRRTIDSNSALETGLGHTSLFFGGVTMLFVFHFVPHTFDGHFLNFDEHVVQVIYFSLMALTIVSVVLFTFLPTKQFDSIALNTPRVTPSLLSQFKRFGESFTHLNTSLLIFTYVYMGCMVSFMYGIYPTSLSFTSETASDVYIIALYLLSSGAAAFLSAMFIRPMIKRLHKYKLIVPMAVHCTSMAIVMVLVYCSVPNEATQKPTSNMDVLITPSRYLSILIGFLLGFADFTITMTRSVICQIAVPDYRAEIFSLTRIYQCVASCVILFISPYLTVRSWILILIVFLLAGIAAMFAVLCRTHNNTVAAPIEPLEEEKDEKFQEEKTFA